MHGLGMHTLEGLTTDRLQLRRPTLEDAPVLFARYCQDPEVTRYMTWAPHRTIDDTMPYLRDCVAQWDSLRERAPYVIERRDDAHLLGMIELSQRSGIGVGYVLARPFWGQGFMTEIASAVVDRMAARPDVHRVWATTDVDNVGSARVLERIGMQREGRLRRHMLRSNLSAVPRDSWIYSRIKVDETKPA